MTQAELNRQVARATGETVATVKHMGFLLADPDLAASGSDADLDDPQLIDWDAFDERRYSGPHAHRVREPAFA